MEFEECERLIHQFLDKRENELSIQEMINRKEMRLIINLDELREFSPDLAKELIKKPSRIQAIFEDYLNSIIDQDEIVQKQRQKQNIKSKQERYQVSFNGNFGKNMISPRGLNANLANQLVCVQGIVTRTSLVRPKLVKSYHYCEQTKQGSIKEYNDQYTNNPNLVLESFKHQDGNVSNTNNLINTGNNSVPLKDNFGNSLQFEYGISEFKDFQVILMQEPPERTPLGQLPRNVEVVLQDDLVDKLKPGDRMQIVGIFKCIASSSTNISGNFRTVLIASSVYSLTTEINVPKVTSEDIREINKLSTRHDFFDILCDSLAPSIYGSDYIKKALILQLLGGVEKNLEHGTHLRGDINVMLIGDPSTAKSQFLRHILSISPNAIATTGRGSTGVGLTAAIVVDKDTGERHLEAGAMVLGDRGVVCIDEFDKMNEIDRVAIHEVMEQQTVTIAKAGIHVSLNARCSVLSAANPIYGEYQKDMPAAKNIGLPDSLLSRFDLVFICLDEKDPILDRNISDRVIRNHQFPSDIHSILTGFDEKIIEPEINNDDEAEHQVFKKYNKLLHGNTKKKILTKNFLKKYIFYAKKTVKPLLTDNAKNKIMEEWTKLRENKDLENENNFQAVPITVRTLETLIRLSTAHAKARLSKNVEVVDCEFAVEILKYTLGDDKAKKNSLKKVDEDYQKNNLEENNKKREKRSSEKKKQRITEIEDVDEENINNIEDVENLEENNDMTNTNNNINNDDNNLNSERESEHNIKKTVNPITNEIILYVSKLCQKLISNNPEGSCTFSEIKEAIKNDDKENEIIQSDEILNQIIENLHESDLFFYDNTEKKLYQS